MLKTQTAVHSEVLPDNSGVYDGFRYWLNVKYSFWVKQWNFFLINSLFWVPHFFRKLVRYLEIRAAIHNLGGSQQNMLMIKNLWGFGVINNKVVKMKQKPFKITF